MLNLVKSCNTFLPTSVRLLNAKSGRGNDRGGCGNTTIISIVNTNVKCYVNIYHKNFLFGGLLKVIALRRVASRRVASRRVASRRVASRRVASRRVASRRVASRRVASRRVASRRVALHCSLLATSWLQSLVWLFCSRPTRRRPDLLTTLGGCQRPPDHKPRYHCYFRGTEMVRDTRYTTLVFLHCFV